LLGKTPYEARFNTPPDVRHLRPWGAEVWVKPEQTRKLDPRGILGRFVGYSDNHKDAIHVYWPDKRNITVVRNFVWKIDSATVPSEGAWIEGADNASDGDEVVETDADARTDAGGEGDREDRPAAEARDEEREEGEGEEDALGRAGEIVEEAPAEEALGRGHRIKRPSEYVRRLQHGEGTAD
ncbi:hypothetical protein C2E23DRAFT_712763, partial [Lenzites betulinus]